MQLLNSLCIFPTLFFHNYLQKDGPSKFTLLKTAGSGKKVKGEINGGELSLGPW